MTERTSITLAQAATALEGLAGLLRAVDTLAASGVLPLSAGPIATVLPAVLEQPAAADPPKQIAGPRASKKPGRKPGRKPKTASSPPISDGDDSAPKRRGRPAKVREEQADQAPAPKAVSPTPIASPAANSRLKDDLPKPGNQRIAVLQAILRGCGNAKEITEASGIPGASVYVHTSFSRNAGYLEDGTPYRLTDFGKQVARGG